MSTVTTNNLLRVTTITTKGSGGRNNLGVYISKDIYPLLRSTLGLRWLLRGAVLRILRTLTPARLLGPMVLLLTALALSGCDSEAKRHAAFMPRCEKAGFNSAECEFLFAMAEKASSDSDDAAVLGMSFGSSINAARR